MQEETRHKRLRYETELSPFMEYIKAHYHESSETVFRSTLSSPPTEADSKPQLKRVIDEHLDELDWQITEEDVAEMSEKEKCDYVSERALSVFNSLSKCKANVINLITHIAKKYSYNEAATYLNERRGAFIVELALTEEAGLIEKRYDKKGHQNFLPYDGVLIDKFIVNTYGPLDIDDILKPDDTVKIKDDGDKK